MAHIRGYIYLFSAALALAVFAHARATAGALSLEYIELAEAYGLIATAYLFCALLPSPLYAAFPSLPGRAPVTRARRAIGVSTFCFALLHTLVGFFKLLSGFEGLPFLPAYERYDLGFAVVALLILFLMAATSNDYSVRLLGPWWKRVHRFVYLAGLLAFLHIVMFGSHFMFFAGPYYAALVTAAALLLALECMRAARRLSARMEPAGRVIALAVGLALVALLWGILVFNAGSLGALNMGAMGMPGMEMDM